MKIILFNFLILIFFISCANNQKNSSKNFPKETNVSITDSLTGNRWSNIYFSGQPSEKDYQKLREDKFSAVINLREKSEKSYSEKWEQGIAQKNGLAYYNHPFSMNKELTDDYITKVTKSIVKHRKEGKVLVHCSTGNKVGVWLGAHFKKDHKFSSEKSLELAQELGLKKSIAIEKLKAYLSSK
ncbi:sulfur transferase domain-containing protein [Bacteriovoracaceae bacterium]|nr:sulfur transferase domain-containing protein [Bacteriovoracaceae bacterium]